MISIMSLEASCKDILNAVEGLVFDVVGERRFNIPAVKC